MTPTPRVRPVLLALTLAFTGVAGGTVGASDSAAAIDYQRYIARAAEAAKASKKLYGVPRAVTIAQSILESGWGRSGLSAKQNNYFGIKCSALVSPYQRGCVSLKSYEYVKGKKKKYVSRFRIYSSMERSFLDHGRLLNRADRYNAAFRYTKDPDRFIREVHKAGYATDPKYATSVINLMRKWNLYRFDSAPRKAARPDPNLALIRTVAPLAQRTEAATGVPSSVTIAQALYHSSAGRSTLAKKARNYFGLTCKGRSKHAKKACLKQGKSKYRTYASLKNSVADQAAVLSTTKHYAAAMKKRNSPKAFLNAIAKARWSTKKSYAGTVYKLITRYGLTKYDLLINITLKQGSRGAKVIALQHLLRARGAKVKTTGYFGTDTRSAVRSYQKRAKLPVTGKADPLTLTRLTPDVRKGSKGSAVNSLHRLLRGRTYTVDKGSAFGVKTQKAVKTLQKRTKLPTTGIVSVRTWGVLFG